MRVLFRLFLFVLFGLPAVLVVVALLALEDEPALESTGELSAASIKRARALVGAHDPRALSAGTVRTLRLKQADLQLAASYAATRVGRGGAKVSVVPGRMHVAASSELPLNDAGGSGHYLNVVLTLEQSVSGAPRVTQLSVGAVPVPAFLANAALRWALTSSTPNQPAATLLREVVMTPGELAVTYEWRPDVLDGLRARVISDQDRGRLEFYQRALVRNVTKLAKDSSVAALLGPMFALAEQRSDELTAIAENRALLLVLSAYSNGRGLSGLVPQAQDWPKPRRVTLRLRNRRDSAQHYLTSAGLVVLGGNRFADVIGLAKEVADAGGGSGFSFTDLAADRAGTLLGETALYSQASARALQRKLARGVADSALAPKLNDLPEYLSEAEFKRRYGSLRSAEYRAEIARIERRLAVLTLYRRMK